MIHTIGFRFPALESRARRAACSVKRGASITSAVAARLTELPHTVEDSDVKPATRLLCAGAIAVAAIAAAIFGGLELQKRSAREARARAEPWREAPDWRGTKVDAALILPPPVSKAFADDPPAPEERKRPFAPVLDPSAPYRCVAWRGMIDRVTPTGDGYEVSIDIRAELPGTWHFATMSAEAWHVSETWHVSRAGGARCLKCTLGEGYRDIPLALFRD